MDKRFIYSLSFVFIFFNFLLSIIVSLSHQRPTCVSSTSPSEDFLRETFPGASRAWINYVITNHCSLNPLHYQQIEDDLKIFRTLKNETHPYPITREMLDYAKSQINMYGNNFWVFQFLKDSVNVTQRGVKLGWTPRVEKLYTEIAPFLPYGLEVIWNDEALPVLEKSQVEETQRKLFPIFSIAKKSNFLDLLAPSFVHYYQHCMNQNRIPWEEKKNVDTLFWRGATTGATVGPNMEYKTTLRYRLVEWAGQYNRSNSSKMEGSSNFSSSGYPRRESLLRGGDRGREGQIIPKFDIAFSELVQCGGVPDSNLTLCWEYVKNYTFQDKIPCLDHEHYRYLLIVDGNSWVQRYVQFLRFESILFYNPHYIEWYTNYIMKPKELYIPISDNWAELPAKFSWALEHEEEMKAKAKQQASFARKYLREEDMECYLFRLLERYGQLVEPLPDPGLENPSTGT